MVLFIYLFIFITFKGTLLTRMVVWDRIARPRRSEGRCADREVTTFDFCAAAIRPLQRDVAGEWEGSLHETIFCEITRERT